MAKRKNASKKKKKRSPKIRRDWSHLPPELLQSIASFIGDISDYIRFLSACKPWHFALKPSISYTPHLFLPWLMISADDPTAVNRRFLGLSSDEIFTLHLPEAKGKRILGSSSHVGILLISDTPRTASLLNPHTRALTKLPPLTLSKQREVQKGVCSNIDTNYVVMVSFRYSSTLVFCRGGDGSWSKIYSARHSTVVDFAYHDRKFFILQDNGRTSIVDGVTLVGVAEVQEPKLSHLDRIYRRHIRDQYLVGSVSGQLLLVVWQETGYYFQKPVNGFEVFRLDMSNQQQPKWLRVYDIGNNVLFLDDHHAISMDAASFSGFGGNRIYFVVQQNWDDENILEVCFFDIEEGTVHHTSFGWSKFTRGRREVAWILPSLLII